MPLNGLKRAAQTAACLPAFQLDLVRMAIHGPLPLPLQFLPLARYHCCQCCSSCCGGSFCCCLCPPISLLRLLLLLCLLVLALLLPLPLLLLELLLALLPSLSMC